jgi:outer membrane protein assembly factor BamB
MKNLLCLSILSFVAATASAENWNQFRGPTGMGVAEGPVPTQWSNASIAWKVELPGQGQSSAINWGPKLFVTAADEDGGTRTLLCLDKETGEILWQRDVATKQKEALHKMNSWATPSAVTDGERVVAFFGPAGIHCYDMEGKKQWSKDLGGFPGNWGIAASPVIQDGQVIQNCDATGPSRLVSLDKETGEIIWETKRNDKPRGGWSTPIVIKTKTGPQLVLNGEDGAKGYDPVKGNELWFCQSFNGRGSPVPFHAHGLVYVVNGKPGDLYVINPNGAKGNVTKTHMAWHAKRNGGRDLPSPSVIGDHALVTAMGGVITCYDAKTGKTHWVDRLDGAFSGSPLIANGLYYIQNEGGVTYVVRPNGKGLEIVSRNNLGAKDGEIFRATLSPIDGKVYTRSQSTLYCLKGEG